MHCLVHVYMGVSGCILLMYINSEVVILIDSHVPVTSSENFSELLLQLKLWGLLPSLASHSVMIPLIVQTIIPMLHKGAKPYVLCKTHILCG